MLTILVRLDVPRYAEPWEVECPALTVSDAQARQAGRRAFWSLVQAGHIELEDPCAVTASVDDGATWLAVPGPWDATVAS